MPHRPPPQPLPAASSSSILLRAHGSSRLFPLFAQLTFHVVPAKLDGDLANVYSWIEELGGRCVDIQDGRFVVTSLKGKLRLERIIGRQWMGKKRIISTDYVQAVYQTAIEALYDEVPPKLLSWENYLVVQPPQLSRAIFVDSSDSEDGSPVKKRRSNFVRENTFSCGVEGPIVGELPDISPFPVDIKFQEIPKRCVERASPLKCINQDIVDAIKPIYEDREFEELSQKNANVLSYRRSMSIIKSLPRRLRSGKDARKLVDVGEKVAQRVNMSLAPLMMKIDEFLNTGQIAESVEILASPRYSALRDFASVYTIGHHTARDLYDRHNCRTLEDVRQHYINIAEESEAVRLKEKQRRRQAGGMTHVDIVEEWMKLKDELDSKSEVEEIAACIMEHLSIILEGCEYTITGGYRRGKMESNDVDIVFCPPGPEQDIGLLRDLYLRLSAFNIITHVLHVTQRAAESPIHATPQNFDNLDKAFVIFKLPGKGRLHRRVDLISAPRERYAAAVLSWSGSMMFERDLKQVTRYDPSS